jgi:hypothetical protein
MEKETLKNIFNFLEEKEGHNTPFIWKLKNNIPLSEEELDVKGNLNLTDKNITSLPEGLKIDGDLDLIFTHITSLPKGLEVGGELDISYTGITLLPEGLKIGGWLYIVDTKLTKYTDKELREMIYPGFIKGEIRR